MTNGSNPDRPWYSFRWRLLLWIAVPLLVISLADMLAAFLAASRSQ